MTHGLHLLQHALAVAALAVTVGAVSSDAAAARHRHPFHCRFAQRHTIAASREARVYVGHGPVVGNGTVFGCLYGSTRRVVLGGTGDEIAPTHVQLAGRYFGFFYQSSGGRSRSGPSAEVDVVDLKSGKHIRLEGGSAASSISVVGLSLVLKANGAVGWIVETVDQSTPRVAGFEVHAADVSGSRLLDSSARIDPSSLALGGSSLYWTDAGQARSARLR